MSLRVIRLLCQILVHRHHHPHSNPVIVKWIPQAHWVPLRVFRQVNLGRSHLGKSRPRLHSPTHAESVISRRVTKTYRKTTLS